jgi:hypothetical protein
MDDMNSETMPLASNSGIHLTRWAVTVLAREQRPPDRHPGPQGSRQPRLVGDASVWSTE